MLILEITNSLCAHSKPHRSIVYWSFDVAWCSSAPGQDLSELSAYYSTSICMHATLAVVYIHGSPSSDIILVLCSTMFTIISCGYNTWWVSPLWFWALLSSRQQPLKANIRDNSADKGNHCSFLFHIHKEYVGMFNR